MNARLARLIGWLNGFTFRGRRPPCCHLRLHLLAILVIIHVSYASARFVSSIQLEQRFASWCVSTHVDACTCRNKCTRSDHYEFCWLLGSQEEGCMSAN